MLLPIFLQWCRQRPFACWTPDSACSSCPSRRPGAEESARQIPQRSPEERTESSIQGDTAASPLCADEPGCSTRSRFIRKWAQARAEQELKKVLTADDAPAALRLVLNDAATYDVDSGAGGLNGSIVLRWVAVTFRMLQSRALSKAYLLSVLSLYASAQKI